MRLTIHNFRVGFATNSSSSHSLVMIPPSAVGRVGSIETQRSGSYGWDHFRLVTTEEKLRYLAAQLFSQALSEQDRRAFVQTFQPYVGDIASTIPPKGTSVWEWDDALTVDHQSKMRAPERWDQTLADSLIKLFLNPELVVLGGNDNDDSTYNAVPGQTISPLSSILTEGSTTRYRLDGEAVVLFDSYTGTKTRMSLSGGPVAAYTKSRAPELVDLKITEYCGSNCKFCYQGSTTDGVHAPLDRIKAILSMLARMEVFEVAIGGGEPTDHPDFAEILEFAKAVGVKPNFTTLSDRWLENEAIVNAVGAGVGGIGVSCQSEKGLSLFGRIAEVFGNTFSPTVSAQHVIGAVPLHVTASFLDAALAKRVPVLLLGFKPVGFGADYTRHDEKAEDVPFFIKMAVSKHTQVSLSVDTALIDQYPTLPALLGAPDALVTSPEGKFSCYIDAVRQTMAASSYGRADAADPLPMDDDGFLQIYAAY